MGENMTILRKAFILVYPWISVLALLLEGRTPVIISTHVIRRAKQREIGWPDQVYEVIATGRVERFGKRGIRFTKRGKHGSIICIGEDLGNTIFIKTIERGN